jgi:hypothetical protein
MRAGILLHFECVTNWEPNASRRETGLLIPSPASGASSASTQNASVETATMGETRRLATDTELTGWTRSVKRGSKPEGFERLEASSSLQGARWFGGETTSTETSRKW